MRRLVLLTYMGLMLACQTGCHLLPHKKHHATECCAPAPPCGCDGPIAGPIDPIPAPAGVIVSAPPKVIPGPPPIGIPGPPGR